MLAKNADGIAQRQHAHSFFEELFLASPEAIVVADNDGNILEANPQTELLFGYACGELLGNPIEILVPDRLRPVHAAHRNVYRNAPHVRPMGAGHDLYGKRKDGSEFPVDIMLSPMETARGHIVMSVIRDITERKQTEELMQKLALSDPLTGIGNYRRLQEAFDTESKWFNRTGRHSTLLLLDIDGLKQINDTQGHLVGSRAICSLANALQVECRAIDTAARYGGDEFAVLMPDTNAEGAKNLACRVERRLANDDKSPRVFFSYGVGAYPQDGKTLQQLLAVADQPLYEMKKSKRNHNRAQNQTA
jgi:diguanylate cyclase (GGDEF)-like protein/PAS domain S-box-containing protein